MLTIVSLIQDATPGELAAIVGMTIALVVAWGGFLIWKFTKW